MWCRGSAGALVGVQPVDLGEASTCTEAKKYGYGPYHRSLNPEYNWYQDRDHDGVVCE
jgi:hypothetical protein